MRASVLAWAAVPCVLAPCASAWRRRKSTACAVWSLRLGFATERTPRLAPCSPVCDHAPMTTSRTAGTSSHMRKAARAHVPSSQLEKSWIGAQLAARTPGRLQSDTEARLGPPRAPPYGSSAEPRWRTLSQTEGLRRSRARAATAFPLGSSSRGRTPVMNIRPVIPKSPGTALASRAAQKFAHARMKPSLTTPPGATMSENMFHSKPRAEHAHMAGCALAAARTAVVPSYERPWAVTAPLHHGCAPAHTTSSRASSASASENGIGHVPSEAPVPRTSAHTTAKPAPRSSSTLG
mmetsp:Transcript_7869/g.21456  ORF Transcript_7869/g.21456 Transcript_7869/m.21456 type:complete len:293 (-) Transcript_7869:233-1111(-)